MTTLDDKLLGEKLHYYCSSSEDEQDSDAGEDEGARATGGEAPPVSQGANTGPKGVIEDWRRFKQLEAERKDEQEAERLALAKKLSLTCRTDREDAEAKEREDRLEAELEGLLDEEEFLQSYMKKRMQEMMQTQVISQKRFGVVSELRHGDDFLSTVDNADDKCCFIVIFIFERTSPVTKKLLSAISEIAQDYPMTKFCTIEATSVGLSHHFKIGGVPAVLTYKGGDLIGNFVRITDSIGEDFYTSDLESFLIEQGILTDKDLMPSAVREPLRHTGDDDDSD